jgi:hypothetical protein
LFSRDRVADFINANFEPAWESVRPVPIVRVDFGNGTVLTRTLHGNILTSVSTADGRVLDALPGIYAEDVYVDRLDQLRLLARYVRTQPPAQQAGRVRDYHRAAAAALARNQPAPRFVEAKRVQPVSKAVIERPVELVLEPPGGSRGGEAVEPSPARHQARTPPGAADLSHWKELTEDTQLNEGTRRRQIHELLVATGPVPPDRVVRPIYKDVLQADLDDPYLGLGKALFERYPFAREDQNGPEVRH